MKVTGECATLTHSLRSLSPSTSRVQLQIHLKKMLQRPASTSSTCTRYSVVLVCFIHRLESSCFDGIRYGTRNLTKFYRRFDSVADMQITPQSVLTFPLVVIQCIRITVYYSTVPGTTSITHMLIIRTFIVYRL